MKKYVLDAPSGLDVVTDDNGVVLGYRRDDWVLYTRLAPFRIIGSLPDNTVVIEEAKVNFPPVVGEYPVAKDESDTPFKGLSFMDGRIVRIEDSPIDIQFAKR
jgi:hypothetical protein